MVVRTASWGHLGLREEGREWVGRIRDIAPQLTVSNIRRLSFGILRPRWRWTYQVDGLTKAGLRQE